MPQEPQRIQMFGREHPGVGCRVAGIPGSQSYADRRGVIVGRHIRNKAMVWVRWADEPGGEHDEAVVISLLMDEPVLDQMSRVRDGS